MAQHNQRSGTGPGGPAKKPMGIQFVKASNSLHTDSTTSQAAASASSSTIPSLMSRPVSASSYGFSSAGKGFSPRTEGSSQYRSNSLSNGGQGSSSLANDRVAPAKPVLSREGYANLLKGEPDPVLMKFRKLALEVVSLKSDRPNATDKIHSAANRVPIKVDFFTEPLSFGRAPSKFGCSVRMEGVKVGYGQAARMKDSKVNAYEDALQKLFMPHLRIIQLDMDTQGLESSREPFSSPPPQPSTTNASAQVNKSLVRQMKESNLQEAGIKRRFNEVKPLEEFVIVEPKIPVPDCTAAHTLRRSADFNHMLLEHEYFFKGDSAVRCVLKIENQVLADVNSTSKLAAKNQASVTALAKLKEICWVIKTKQATDAEECNRISKEEMLNELSEQSEAPEVNNVASKLMQKMGWSGGGMGKDGTGIAEPISLTSVMNREGLGLTSSKGVTDDFRKRVRELIENYASSDNQEDLVFNCDFRLEERQIIHNECRRLNLKSKSRGKGQSRYLCVRRKRSANQLFQHLMSCGGETHRYELVPPARYGQQAPKQNSFPGGASSGMASGFSQSTGGGQFHTGPNLGNFGSGTNGSSMMGNGGFPTGPRGQQMGNGSFQMGMQNKQSNGFVMGNNGGMMGNNGGMMGNNGGMMGNNGGMMGSNGSMMGNNGGMMRNNGGMMGNNVSMMGNNGSMMGNNGSMMGNIGGMMGNNGNMMGNNRGMMGNNGGIMGNNGGMMGNNGGMMGNNNGRMVWNNGRMGTNVGNNTRGQSSRWNGNNRGMSGNNGGMMGRW